MKYAIAIGLALSLCVPLARAQEKNVPVQEVRTGDPKLLSFDELVTLSSTAQPKGELSTRLASLLTTPFVHNDANAAGVQPHRPSVAVENRISDHAPMTVELPLREPSALIQAQEK